MKNNEKIECKCGKSNIELIPSSEDVFDVYIDNCVILGNEMAVCNNCKCKTANIDNDMISSINQINTLEIKTETHVCNCKKSRCEITDVGDGLVDIDLFDCHLDSDRWYESLIKCDTCNKTLKRDLDINVWVMNENTRLLKTHNKYTFKKYINKGNGKKKKYIYIEYDELEEIIMIDSDSMPVNNNSKGSYFNDYKYTLIGNDNEYFYFIKRQNINIVNSISKIMKRGTFDKFHKELAYIFKKQLLIHGFNEATFAKHINVKRTQVIVWTKKMSSELFLYAMNILKVNITIKNK